MRTRGWLTVSAVATVAMTVGVIVVPGYYESPALLPTQIALVAAPVFLPLAIASTIGTHRGRWWLFCFALVALSWLYVVYIDARPDRGGGASFAVMIGWMGSSLALVVAIAGVVVARLRFGRGRSRS